MNASELYPSFETYENLVKQFSSCMHDYLYIYGIERDTYCISPNALERFAIPAQRFTDVVKMHKQFVHPEDLDMLTEDLNQMIRGEKQQHDLRYRWIGKDGSPIWINCKGRMLVNPEGKHMMIGCINEIGKSQNADNISGLLGENAFKEGLRSVENAVDKISILRIGIDDFKTINERLGNEFGNAVIKSVAKSIEKCLLPGQMVYRIISDEFMVLDLLQSNALDMKMLYRRIRSSVDDAVEDMDYDALYTISGGILEISDKIAHGYEDIMKRSEYALSEAKKRGKNQAYIYQNEDYEAFLEEQQLLIHMKHAVKNGFEGFSLNYQPLVLVSDENLFAAEALLRYQTPDGKMVSPLEFIPILEDSGLIVPVGKWVIRNALSLCKACQLMHDNFKLSVNISYVQLLKSPLVEDIKEIIQEIDISPDSLILEMTESGELEKTAFINGIWDKFREFGIAVAIDDFGTGYSNLHSIGFLKPDIVKIDRSFTLRALQNDYEYQLMIHIIRMVHSIGITLVVEGIETLEELRKITMLQPDYIQGYYYSRPCTREAFIEKYID